MNGIESLKQQLKMASKLQNYLDVQAAQYTDASMPAELSMQIEEQREKIKTIEDRISQMNGDEKSKIGASQSIPFTNRDDDLRDLRSSGAPPYFLIDAPAGYGKTELLKKLNELLNVEDKERWLSAYVGVTENTTLPEMVLQLAEQLGVSEDLNSDLSWSHRLGSALRLSGKYATSVQGAQKGVILLIDFDKYPTRERVKETIDELIPLTQQFLRTDNSPPNFRCIVAGRYLNTLREAQTRKLKFASRCLDTFNYEVIQKSIKNYTNCNDQVVAQLAAHLLYLTGGHPGYLAQALAIYDASPADMFFQGYREKILNITIRNSVDILDGLPDEFIDLKPIILNHLNVLRRFDRKILTQAMMGSGYEMQNDQNLDVRLVQTYLFTRSKEIIYDDIVRRVLAIRSRNQNPGTFSESCRKARDIYAQRIQEDGRNLEKWGIEYLFQSLQLHANDINDARNRNKLHRSFFRRKDGDVDTMLALLMKNPDYKPEMKGYLIEDLNKDWEFQFTINYYLRKDQYTEQPYNDLVKAIER